MVLKPNFYKEHSFRCVSLFDYVDMTFYPTILFNNNCKDLIKLITLSDSLTPNRINLHK